MHKLQRILAGLLLCTLSHTAVAAGEEPTPTQLEKTVRAWFVAIEAQYKEMRMLCTELDKSGFRPSEVGGRSREKSLQDCARFCGPDYNLCLEPFTAIKVEKIKCEPAGEYYACWFLLIAETNVPRGQMTLKRFVDSNNIARGLFAYGPDGLAFSPGL